MWRAFQVPGSHNSKMKLPGGLQPEELPIAQEICAEPGTAIMFHQGTYHTGAANVKPYNRYIQHMAYSAPWLVRSGRVRHDPAALTTPRRQMLLGSFTNAKHAFHGLGPVPKL